MGGIFRVIWPIILGLAMLMYPTTADSPGWWLGGVPQTTRQRLQLG